MPRPKKAIRARIRPSGLYQVQYAEDPGHWYATGQDNSQDALAWARRKRGEILAPAPILFKDAARGFFDDGSAWARRLAFAFIAWLAILRFLKPLFHFLERGEGREEAQRSIAPISLVLVLIHVGSWLVGTTVFYAIYRFRSPGGIPYAWSLLLTMPTGFLAGIATALAMNALLVKCKLQLEIHSMAAMRRDLFSRLKDYLIPSGTLLCCALWSAFAIEYFHPGAPGGEAGLGRLQAVLSLTAAGFLLVGFLLTLLARIEYSGQLKSLRTSVQALATSGGNIARRLPILNVDETGEAIAAVNGFLDALSQLVTRIFSLAEETDAAAAALERSAASSDAALGEFEKSLSAILDGIEGVKSASMATDRETVTLND